MKSGWLLVLLPATLNCCSAAPEPGFTAPEPAATVTEPACVPVGCGASTCGAIPDGCGGVVHCGVCTNPRQGCYYAGSGCTGTFLLCGQSNGSSCPAADAKIATDPVVCATYVRSCQ